MSWASLLAVLDRELVIGLEPALTDLVARYREPHRRYHGVAHLDALAQLFEQVAAGPGWSQPVEVALAILFHDAIYEPARSDNEARSADLARAALAVPSQAGATGVDVERVAALILATAAHGHAAVAEDPDLGLFLDADVSILGAPEPVYADYAQGVFEEFAPLVGEDRYRSGRRAFLRGQLERASLFHSPWFRDRFEAQARLNLARELARL